MNKKGDKCESNAKISSINVFENFIPFNVMKYNYIYIIQNRLMSEFCMIRNSYRKRALLTKSSALKVNARIVLINEQMSYFLEQDQELLK